MDVNMHPDEAPQPMPPPAAHSARLGDERHPGARTSYPPSSSSRRQEPGTRSHRPPYPTHQRRTSANLPPAREDEGLGPLSPYGAVALPPSGLVEHGPQGVSSSQSPVPTTLPPMDSLRSPEVSRRSRRTAADGSRSLSSTDSARDGGESGQTRRVERKRGGA
ncbi:hypothetical protein C8F04DRAFT_1128199 [Mycena alexandri]|uniref:Uncharacterized protein n=1 Tax=Mycena alexandri TaxID=1745969 RepID=A0AAD6SD29_9AGAR|nr:hypothetical protein C8F04DRAFT_1128199 [Mycena alexandri]